MKKTADNSEFRMRKPELHEFDAAGLCDGYRHRRFSPIEVCEHLLSRIEDPRLNCNAFAEVDAAGALALAHASAQRWQAGQVLGELDGIPVAIKDVVDVAGLATRYGSPALVDAPPAVEDCLLVRRLRAAGAIILGKTRTWEFAWRAEIGRDPVEVVENPRLPGYSPGGSSSGSAAAVAAGLCPLAFGTDSGGSVRGPAAFCGIFGLKPSHARIPVYPPSPMGELEHNGIFARSVNDIGTALRAVEGFDPSDPASWPFVAALDDPRPRLEDLRFAISPDLGQGNPTAETRAHFGRLIARLRSTGLELDDWQDPPPSGFAAAERLYTPDAALSLEIVPPERRPRASPAVVALAAEATHMSAREYADAELVRDRLRRSFARLLADYDCLLAPVHEDKPNRLEQQARRMKLTWAFDMTGQPALSLPAGQLDGGFPFGLQLICANGADGLLLAIARELVNRLD